MAARTSTSCLTAPTPSSVATSPSSLGCKPSAPRWSIASTGPDRSSRSTDRGGISDRFKSPGFVRGFFVPQAWARTGTSELSTPLLRTSGHATLATVANGRAAKRARGKPMRKLLLIVGLLPLAIGLLWIGQGTGTTHCPPSRLILHPL